MNAPLRLGPDTRPRPTKALFRDRRLRPPLSAAEPDGASHDPASAAAGRPRHRLRLRQRALPRRHRRPRRRRGRLRHLSRRPRAARRVRGANGSEGRIRLSARTRSRWRRMSPATARPTSCSASSASSPIARAVRAARASRRPPRRCFAGNRPAHPLGAEPRPPLPAAAAPPGPRRYSLRPQVRRRRGGAPLQALTPLQSLAADLAAAGFDLDRARRRKPPPRDRRGPLAAAPRLRRRRDGIPFQRAGATASSPSPVRDRRAHKPSDACTAGEARAARRRS